ncbi:MAG: tRNA 2-thiouridine(34) synthase MnmA [Candidatus Saccharimonadales bacterium]
MKQTVYVGMSGGVDSSVTAALLQQQGYHVVGVYMKNWSQDLPGMICPWRDDYQDAKRVAVQLGIDFKMYDFQTEYRQKVVDYMVETYKAGRTPNPDIMCNQEVKFKLFLETALEDGADVIATGHYARTIPVSKAPSDKPVKSFSLRTAQNHDKDQSYFLYRVNETALSKALMPIGDFVSKAEVRSLAQKLGLVTADKKDSQGICFVGKVGIKDFLIHELGEQTPGIILDQTGNTVGRHDGAIYYTLGQRHGLHVGGGLPYYVTGKDMAKNLVFVTTNLDDAQLWNNILRLTDLHWINEAPSPGKTYQARTRYRAPLIDCTIEGDCITLAEPVRAITPGQSTVLYDGDRVVGGGIVI